MAGLVRVSRAEECRNSAAILRLLARKTAFPDSRDDLLKLAVVFERLAAQIEAREVITSNAAD